MLHFDRSDPELLLAAENVDFEKFLTLPWECKIERGQYTKLVVVVEVKFLREMFSNYGTTLTRNFSWLLVALKTVARSPLRRCLKSKIITDYRATFWSFWTKLSYFAWVPPTVIFSVTINFDYDFFMAVITFANISHWNALYTYRINMIPTQYSQCILTFFLCL